MKVAAQVTAACFGIGAVHQAVNFYNGMQIPSQLAVEVEQTAVLNAARPSMRRAESTPDTSTTSTTTPACHTSFNCIGLTEAQCADLIDHDLEDCPLDFDLVVSPPRTMSSYERTYNFVGIPLNILGQVVGFQNNGAVKYSAFLWEGISQTEPRKLPDVDCAGMQAQECCVKVKAAVPDQDIHGQSIECFYLVLPPEPLFKLTESGTEYLQYHTWMHNAEGEAEGYVYAPIDSDEVKALNDDARNQLTHHKDTIHNLLTEMSGEEVKYSELLKMAETLSYETRHCGSSQYLSQLLDNHLVAPVGVEDAPIALEGKLREHLDGIKQAIQRCLSGHTVGGHHSAVTGRGIISMHATADGIVVNDPKIEGPTI